MGTRNKPPKEPTVQVFLPLLDDIEGEACADQTEQVVVNGQVTRIQRGAYVDVKPEVFCQLKRRYPGL